MLCWNNIAPRARSRERKSDNEQLAMSSWALLREKEGEFGPWLRRAFWLPVRGTLRTFHVLPVIAAAVVFVLLATDGQLREIYASYMEDIGTANFFATAFRLAAAAFAFTLISAVLYEAHRLLSAGRAESIHASSADLALGARPRPVREAAAIVLALSPWLGLAFGLLNAKFYLADLFAKLQQAGATGLDRMQHVPMPSSAAIVAGILLLGLVLSYLVAASPKNPLLQRAVIIANPPTATLLFLLLETAPQKNPSTAEVVETWAVICGVTAVYYFIYERLYSMRALVFSRGVQESTGLNLRKYYRLLLFAWVLLPWLIVIVLHFTAAPQTDRGALHSWAMIPIAMSWVISIGLFVTSVLYRYRERAVLKWWIYGAVVSLAVAGLFSSWLPPGVIVTIDRALGPLSSMAFALLFLTFVFALLAVLSQRSGFPVLSLVILALVGSVLVPLPIGWTVALLSLLCLVIFFAALLAQLRAVACVALILALAGAINFAKLHGVREVHLRATADAPTLQAQFHSWLQRTKLAAVSSGGSADAGTPAACASRYSGTSDPYPVYIIAAAGGGIYAASAASMFLARLQDYDPCFAQHVFALSAVSGGAIGATIFQAVAQSPLSATAATAASVPTNRGCLPPDADAGQTGTDQLLEREVCAVIQDDHFSPLVASIFPELLGFTRSGRAQELVQSFDNSVRQRNPGAAKVLDERFDDFAAHWSDSGTPAPVLNTTWVETGYRAAFAPFPLHAIDGSLYSFADKNMPDDTNLTVLGAAVVSARFPAVLPPYSLLIGTGSSKASSAGGSERWNFVDGGYSDTSGAATALALYDALKPAAKAANVVLRVILLTSSDPRLEPNAIDGTAFADTLGPIDAMLSVRDGLGNEAVARACDGILGASLAHADSSESRCEDLTGKPDSPFQIVGIEDATYGLSLGWKISQTTFGVVSWMLGEPQFATGSVCQGEAPNKAPTPQANGQFTLNEKIVCANSRVLAAVLESLK
jgi:hypothetical protein